MLSLQHIGVIRTPFAEPKGTPIQPTAAQDVEGVVEVFSAYAEGLKDIEGFSHLILLYQLHLAKPADLLVKPFLGNELHGVFATRSPARPNPLGLSVVRLIRREGHLLHIRDVDIVAGTPLLDIKPYVAEFDARQQVTSGWFEQNIHKLKSTRDDGRFT
ncbi:MAG TPA: tRNA (N6-threonylcarbamoyladenosine(37)-N6)-methyltransferase TrmO [Patescibacteria group bacterium]|nr:tRNA (N6-threonylcarbamoyladenosine(37)-N6)-methyltransferase TrmO [Patescibacteria group bacterium]